MKHSLVQAQKNFESCPNLRQIIFMDFTPARYTNSYSSLILRNKPDLDLKFDISGEHLMNAWRALVVLKQWLGTTELEGDYNPNVHRGANYHPNKIIY